MSEVEWVFSQYQREELIFQTFFNPLNASDRELSQLCFCRRVAGEGFRRGFEGSQKEGVRSDGCWHLSDNQDHQPLPPPTASTPGTTKPFLHPPPPPPGPPSPSSTPGTGSCQDEPDCHRGSPEQVSAQQQCQGSTLFLGFYFIKLLFIFFILRNNKAS